MEQEIRRALAEKKLVEFYYHGFYRIAEPHILGINGGVKQLLGYQVKKEQCQEPFLPDIGVRSCIHTFSPQQNYHLSRFPRSYLPHAFTILRHYLVRC